MAPSRLDRVTVACTDQPLETRNQLNLTAPHTLTIAVAAPDAIRWAMLVQR